MKVKIQLLENNLENDLLKMIINESVRIVYNYEKDVLHFDKEFPLQQFPV
jgi:hypothetical protein